MDDLRSSRQVKGRTLDKKPIFTISEVWQSLRTRKYPLSVIQLIILGWSHISWKEREVDTCRSLAILPPFGLLGLMKVFEPITVSSLIWEDSCKGWALLSLRIGRIVIVPVDNRVWKNFFSRGRKAREEFPDLDLRARERHNLPFCLIGGLG
jgi:hypothetical protein